MIGELDLYGAYVPWLLILGLAAWIIVWLAQKTLSRLGVYRIVWHPPLFNLALYVIVLYGVARASPWIFQR